MNTLSYLNESCTKLMSTATNFFLLVVITYFFSRLVSSKRVGIGPKVTSVLKEENSISICETSRSSVELYVRTMPDSTGVDPGPTSVDPGPWTYRCGPWTYTGGVELWSVDVWTLWMDRPQARCVRTAPQQEIHSLAAFLSILSVYSGTPANR